MARAPDPAIGAARWAHPPAARKKCASSAVAGAVAAGMTAAITKDVAKPQTPPKHYDEITRTTAPVIDLFRPTSPPTSIGERELESRVRLALRADSRLNESEIDVLVHGSEVRLTGRVIGPGTAAYAADVAAAVAGVTKVHNEIVAVP